MSGVHGVCALAVMPVVICGWVLAGRPAAWATNLRMGHMWRRSGWDRTDIDVKTQGDPVE